MKAAMIASLAIVAPAAAATQMCIFRTQNCPAVPAPKCVEAQFNTCAVLPELMPGVQAYYKATQTANGVSASVFLDAACANPVVPEMQIPNNVCFEPTLPVSLPFFIKVVPSAVVPSSSANQATTTTAAADTTTTAAAATTTTTADATTTTTTTTTAAALNTTTTAVAPMTTTTGVASSTAAPIATTTGKPAATTTGSGAAFMAPSLFAIVAAVAATLF